MPSNKLFNRELLDYIHKSPTPFHAVANLSEALLSAGFEALSEAADWSLQPGRKYFVTRNGSSLIAFTLGKADLVENGIRLVGAHTDSPCLMIKPQPELHKSGYLQLGVEVYGGALLNPWFDRDLSIAGRIVYRDSEGHPRQKLIDFGEPVAVIPSLAIHLDRNVNENRSINAQMHMPPVLMRVENKQSFRSLLAKRFLKSGQEVLDYELCLYDLQPPAVVGLNKEFLAAARLDNLLSCFAGMRALCESDSDQTAVLVCNDHEEVGSVSAIGADGPFLESVLRRLATKNLDRVLDNSLLISCDNAHALHPNYADRHDESHQPILNGGPAIKMNVKQRYATNSLSSALFRQLCDSANVPVQSFVARSDMGCGSTIGPITAARLGVKTLDVGIPQLAMHSCRELTGAEDPLRLTKVLKLFFNVPGPLAVVAG